MLLGILSLCLSAVGGIIGGVDVLRMVGGEVSVARSLWCVVAEGIYCY